MNSKLHIWVPVLLSQLWLLVGYYAYSAVWFTVAVIGIYFEVQRYYELKKRLKETMKHLDEATEMLSDELEKQRQLKNAEKNFQIAKVKASQIYGSKGNPKNNKRKGKF
jgi:hypothetical protein